jgi:hypothetical protein
MEGSDMQKFIPALKVALIASIGIIVFAMAANLVLGNIPAMLKMMFPLLGGLFAWRFLNRSASATPPECPTCATQQPIFRRPTSFRQMMSGGWTCANCGTEMDRKGHAIDRQNGHHA